MNVLFKSSKYVIVHQIRIPHDQNSSFITVSEIVIPFSLSSYLWDNALNFLLFKFMF